MRVNIWWQMVSAFLFAAAMVQANDSPRLPARLSVIDNGVIRIGVDLNRGGSITYIADSEKRINVVNAYDFGREIQQSYFSGPIPFGDSHHRGWKKWGWNPIAAGDVFGHPGRVLAHRRTSNLIYVKSEPLQWALNNVPGECTFETWIELKGSAAHVRCRLVNHRADHTFYPARHQELPAIYSIAKLHRLKTYDGDDPFTDGEMREIKNAGPPWTYWRATENWAALVDDQNWGLGVYHPGAHQFVGGFSGDRNRGGPESPSTGYMSPIHTEIMDHNIRYEYEYVLVLGHLKYIRAYVYQQRRDAKPDFRFRSDRQHWHYVNAHDAGFPMRGQLQIRLASGGSQMISPLLFYSATEVPKLYIRAAFHSESRRGRVFWQRTSDRGFLEGQSVDFKAIADGEFHTYEIDLASNPTYRGKIARLRVDPVLHGGTGESVDVEFISWKNE